MASFNRVMLMGNLTFDLELKYTSGGTAVTEARVACNDRRKNQAGEVIEETVFVDVTLWGRTAELACEYLKKGSPIFIEGRLKYDTWETDGQKRSKLRVVGERMVFLPRGDGGGGGGGGGGGRPSRSYDESEYSRPADLNESKPSPPSGGGGGGGGGGGPPGAEDDDIPF